MQLIITISVIVILILTLLLMRNRSMAIQRFAVLEFVMVLVICTGYYFVDWKLSELYQEQFLAYYERCLDFTTAFTDRLDELEISSIQNENEGWEAELQKILKDAFSIRDVEEDTIGLSVAILERDGRYYNELYYSGNESDFTSSSAFKKEVYPVMEEAFVTQTSMAVIYNEDRCALLLSDTNANAPQRVLCVEISASEVVEKCEKNSRQLLYIVLIIWALGSVIAYMIISLQDLEWKKLTKAVSAAAAGRNSWKRPVVHNTEMQTLWNSFGELVKSIARMNYDKYRMFQAYYRFAPKEIEKILQKSSIIDVTNGDIAEIEGTLALVAMSGDESLKQREYARGMGGKYHILSECQKKEGGIALSGDCDIRNLRYMFLDQKSDAVRFGVTALTAFEAAGVYKNETALLLLHYSKFTYGILGDEEQAAAFILSTELDALCKYKEDLSRSGVRMVVTDTVVHDISEQYTYRYIGYVEENEMVFKLYEILDVYTEKERRIRLSANEKFQQALELFYQDDFYLARNVFTDVLKECPEDGLAKWYMFACEYHLNHPEIEHSYGLFDGNINWQ